MSTATRSTLNLSPKEVIAAIVLFASTVFGLVLVTRGVEGAAKPSIDIAQCANLSSSCDASNVSNWQKGNLGQSNALYFEGQSVPYRSVISGLTIGATYAVRIEWDTTESGKHALDYLTDFDRSEPGADPCATSLCTGSGETLGIPGDPSVSDAGVTQIGGQAFRLWGGTFPGSGATVANTGNLCGTASCTIASNPSSYSRSGDYEGSSQTSIEVFFTATAKTAVLAWGGHIASRLDWGFGKSAVDLSGSPYHMRLTGFWCTDASNCSAGQKDLSLSSTAVVFPGSITIVKDASANGSTEFDFTASPSPLEDFVLVDDGSGSNTRTFSGITSFQQYFVEELAEQGWEFDDVQCELLVDHGGSYAVDGSSLTIDLAEGESITCTYSNIADATTTSTTTTIVDSSSTTSTTTTLVDSSTTTTLVDSSTTTTLVDSSTTTSSSSPSTTTTLPASTTTDRPNRPSRATPTPSTTPVSVAEVSTTTEPAVIGPAEVPADTLPETGGSGRTVVSLGLVLVAVGLLGLALIAIRTVTSPERQS